MLRSHRPVAVAALSTAALVSGLLAAVPPAQAADATAAVVINEVYGGGGNAGAPVQHDFVELFNRGTTPVDLSTWSLQYASATGTAWAVTPLTGTLPPGSSYVVREAAGASTTVPPVTGDAVGTIAMSGTAGKVALVSSTSALTCGAACSATPAVIDFVGFGTTANDFLGSRTPAPSNTTSVSRDAAHSNTANNGVDFTTGAPSPAACGSACTAGPVDPPAPKARSIAEIQGTGPASPLVGTTATTRGVVTAAYPTGGLKGYYLQTPGTVGPTDPATRTASDGVFVFQNAGVLPSGVVPGAYLEVTGGVTEFGGLTELTVAAADVKVLTETPAPVTASTTAAWPRTDAERERLEGMLYRPTGAYTVTDTFATNQFGEVVLASGTTPLIQRTEVEAPGPVAASAVEADNLARSVTLDDGSSTNFLATSGGQLVNGNLTPPYVSQAEPVRVGAPAAFDGDVVVDFRFDTWRFQPVQPVIGPANTASPVSFTNTRTAAPDSAFIGDADIKVASFNVLNYFTTLGESTPGCTAFLDRDGDGSTVRDGCDLRGAWDAEDLARQQSKIVKAVNALDADVVGLIEVENSARLGEPVDEALNTLVSALNADAGAGTWAAVPASAELPAPASRDVITNAIIYKPGAVTTVGASRALGTQSDDGQAFGNAREPVGQVFAPKTGSGGRFLFVVNHFKSKGSAGPFAGDADSGDGQGASNESRVRQATALRDWVPTVLADTGTKAVALAGDFNAYGKEDPLQVLAPAGYTDAEQAFPHGEFSYSFDSRSGSLDHVLLNEAALDRATGADIWNINSGESVALEYSRFNYTATDFHVADPYRSSDHDPVVVGLSNDSAPVPVQLLATNDFHGRLQANGAEAGAAVLAGAVKQLRAAQPNTVFAAAGDLIGASTFESFIAQDKPTIDALNAAGLEVSAVGNHELDQGYDDLVNRVMAPYDATTNPYGGAAWKYLGANVRKKADHSPALPETWTQDFGGITVGFVGAVTEHLPELVSPAGIGDLVIESVVTAANRSADALKAAGADIVVLLVHEGAATTALSSATDPTSDFGRIVNGVDQNVDAIVSGHTHLAYNHAVPVQEWIDEGRPVTTRPVVSAGQYGTNLNQLLFQVDPETEEVVGLTQQVLPLVKDPTYPSDPATKAVVDKAVADAAVLGARTLGQATGPFNRAKLANGTTENRGGESTLGNLVAEVQQTATATQIAFMNPGGLRADLLGNGSGYPTDVTYRQAANVQPFANTLVTMTLSGDQLKAALEQQWQPAGAARPFLRLGISEGFTYTYDPARAVGSRITAMTLNGAPVTPASTYSVTVNSFLASGGDNFAAFAAGTGKRDSGKVDLQTMVDYLLAKGTVSPDYTQRSVGVSFPASAPAVYQRGQAVAFGLSSLAFSTAPDRKDSTVTVTLGGRSVGTFPVESTVGTDVFDEYGTAAVSFPLPADTPAGPTTLTVTGDQTGTVATVPLTVERAPTTTTIASSGSPSALGSPVTFTATVTGPVSGGTVQFAVDGTPLGGPVAVVSGKATSAATSTLGVGSHAVRATFSGDAGAVGSSGSTIQVVERARTTTTVTSSLTPSAFGTAVRFTAKVTGPTSGGTVQFAIDGTKLGSPVALGAGGSATSAPVSTLSVGSHAVTATFSGDEATTTSSGATTQVVQKAVSRTVVTSSASPTAVGATVRFTAVVTGPAVGGSVQFKVDGAALGSPVALSGGRATSPATTFLSAGTYTVTAVFSGDARTLGSSGATSQQVRYVLKVIAPAAGADLKGGSAFDVQLALTDAQGKAIPDATAKALLSPCRVKVSLTGGGQGLSPTCPRYDAEKDRFVLTVKSAKKAGTSTLRIDVAYPGDATQSTYLTLRFR